MVLSGRDLAAGDCAEADRPVINASKKGKEYDRKFFIMSVRQSPVKPVIDQLIGETSAAFESAGVSRQFTFTPGSTGTASHVAAAAC